MDIASVIVVSSLLLLAAAAMMISHVRSWRTFQQEELGDADLEYRRKQFRRRMQTSAMLAVLAVAMAIGYILTVRLHSGLFAGVFWIAILLFTFWVALLAAVDIWATKRHFGRLRHDYMVERAKLQAEARRIQSVRGNGKAKTKDVLKKNQ